MRPRKRDVIVETAHQLFLERGYNGTSMDDVAATSGASKTTVYSNFQDKEKLFTAVVLQITERSQQIADEVATKLTGSEPVEERLVTVARQLARSVLNPSVVQLRRIAISEANRFPELVRIYWDRAPGRVVSMLETAFTAMDAAGELDIPDPAAAALQFAYSVVGPHQDRALFLPDDAIPGAELDAYAEVTAARFVRAHTPGR